MEYQFIDWNPNQKSRTLLESVKRVLVDFHGQGYKLTLRQLYYQLVATDIIPNAQRQYKNLGNLVGKARLAGMLDWDMIEDRGRELKSNSHWSTPGSVLRSAASSYYKDHWVGQAYHVEVWCEKDALSGVIRPVCEQWDVSFMANKGYSSLSAMYEAGQRYDRMIEDEGRTQLALIYLGDHDPSGIDMDRDVKERIELLSDGRYVEVNRIALNMDQVDQYDPPANPTKESDSRSHAYVQEYGSSSWELDALRPSVLKGLVEEAIMKYLDEDEWYKIDEKQEEERERINKTAVDFDSEDDDE